LGISGKIRLLKKVWKENQRVCGLFERERRLLRRIFILLLMVFHSFGSSSCGSNLIILGFLLQVFLFGRKKRDNMLVIIL